MSTNGAQGSQEGSLTQAAGEVKDKLGALADSTRVQVTGKARELYGHSQQLAGDAAAAARATVVENPLLVLAATAAAGFAVGALWAWRRE